MKSKLGVAFDFSGLSGVTPALIRGSLHLLCADTVVAAGIYLKARFLKGFFLGEPPFDAERGDLVAVQGGICGIGRVTSRVDCVAFAPIAHCETPRFAEEHLFRLFPECGRQSVSDTGTRSDALQPGRAGKVLRICPEVTIRVGDHLVGIGVTVGARVIVGAGDGWQVPP